MIAGIMAVILSSPSYIVAQKKVDNNVANTIEKISEKTVQGSVFDEEGEPLVGATVMIEGTTVGVATDLEGNFSLLSPKKNPTVVITYVGMQPVKMKLDRANSYLKIVMKPATNMMDEVVVTGFQNIKRESATGAFQVITSDDLDKRSTTSLASRLEGSVPGVVMDPKSNSKDEDAFTIRGVGTFEAKSSPLVVVDGLPIEGGMSTVNPYDIENIIILKDAAASAIYGARAANGVIVITTKKAHEQRLSVDVNIDLNIYEKQKYDNYEWASAADMIELERYNFNAMLNEPGQAGLNSVLTDYNNNR